MGQLFWEAQEKLGYGDIRWVLLLEVLTLFRDTQADEETTQSILEGCKDLAPKLLDEHGNFGIISVQWGLRPSRNGGPRLETEFVDQRFSVVHGYGHAGAGLE